jgi:3',5'-cyclic AMP phosphodiesterase CpdA
VPLRLAVVSDTHLSRRTPEARANWDAVLAHLDVERPDFVVHVGDLALDGPGDRRDLDDARQALDRLPVPWRAIPGNHDIGDNPRADQPPGEAVADDRRHRWLETIGPDWWAVEQDGWTIIGIDAQLFGSGLDADAEQQAWLDDTLAAVTEKAALVVHKPVGATAEETAAAPPYRYLPAEARSWLGARLEAARVPLVVSGHVHQYRVLDLDGVRHAWAPTTWAVLPDSMQAILGTKQGGYLSVDLGADGPGWPHLVEPPGFRQLTLELDVPNPYSH